MRAIQIPQKIERQPQKNHSRSEIKMFWKKTGKQKFCIKNTDVYNNCFKPKILRRNAIQELIKTGCGTHLIVF